MKEFSTGDANFLFDLLCQAQFSVERSREIADGLAGLFEHSRRLFEKDVPC